MAMTTMTAVNTKTLILLVLHVSFLLIGSSTFANAFTIQQQQQQQQQQQVLVRHHYRRPGSSHNDVPAPRLRSCRDDDNDNEHHPADDTALKMISEMLWKMTKFFGSMVDDDDDDEKNTKMNHRFYYLCLPQASSSEQQRIHKTFPIRDLGAAWDATTVLLFWKSFRNDNKNNNPEYQHVQERLSKAVCGTLQAYNDGDGATLVSLEEDGTTNGGALAISSDALGEPSNIAHSALLLLATLGAMRLSLVPHEHETDDSTATTTTTTTKSKYTSTVVVQGLTRGILSMQRSDGAFRIEFQRRFDEDDDGNVYRGIEFYPGEAMVALMDFYQYYYDYYDYSNENESMPNRLLDSSSSTQQQQQQQQEAILVSMKRAFSFYQDYYKTRNPDVNYNIWQVQAFARLFHVLHRENDDQATSVANYVLELCLDIVESASWKQQLCRGKSFYPNLESVEIACGLDALAQGLSVVVASSQLLLLLLSPPDEQQQQQQDDTNNHHHDHHHHDQVVTRLSLNAENAIDYLKSVQDLLSPDSTGYGGIGYGGLQVLEQRLDVTGHAISALVKLYEVRIRESTPRV
jgi:hypothetical protein